MADKQRQKIKKVEQFKGKKNILELLPDELIPLVSQWLTLTDLANVISANKALRESPFGIEVHKEIAAMNTALDNIRNGDKTEKYDALLARMVANRETKLNIDGIQLGLSVVEVRKIIKTAIESKIVSKKWTHQDILAALKLVRELAWNHKETLTNIYNERFIFSIDVLLPVGSVAEALEVQIWCLEEHVAIYLYTYNSKSHIKIKSTRTEKSKTAFQERLKKFNTNIQTKLAELGDEALQLTDVVDELIFFFDDEIDVKCTDNGDDSFINGIVSAILHSGNPFRIKQNILCFAPFVDRSLVANSLSAATNTAVV